MEQKHSYRIDLVNNFEKFEIHCSDNIDIRDGPELVSYYDAYFHFENSESYYSDTAMVTMLDYSSNDPWNVYFDRNMIVIKSKHIEIMRFCNLKKIKFPYSIELDNQIIITFM